MSTRTYQFACHLPHIQADMLNAESGRIYQATMLEHWRVYRKKGIWLKQQIAMKLNDYYDSERSRILHAHSIDAAQEGFYKACKQVHTKRKQGDDSARFPHKRRRYRTTIWKKSGIYKVEDNIMCLSLAKGLDRLVVPLPSFFEEKKIEQEHILEVRLVFNKASFRYSWHVVVEDGITPEPTGQYIAGIDLGEIHPAVISDGEAACVVSCRELRALNQYRNKRLAELNAKQARYQKGSRRWRHIQRRKRRFLAQCEQRKRDLEHKIARSVVDWARERDIGVLAIGDVRKIADGKRFNKKIQQKISNWSHGTMRKYIGYKAAGVGIRVEDNVSERYTSQTCPNCQHRHKPKGRIFKCPNCKCVFHRDVVGASNIASQYDYGELGRYAVSEPKYRHPVLRGKRSPADTG